MPRQTVRVFISSTFRDMHAERDYLTRMVFPELRRRCRERGVEFLGLDLRWGVTAEESRERGALAICLEEIERCRPFFVCLLGDRYGWVPPPEEIPQDLFEELEKAGELPEEIADWYRLDETSLPPVYRLRRDREISDERVEELIRFWEGHGLEDARRSITASEIFRGVFEEGYPETHALFYLRQPGVERHPDFPKRLRGIFVEEDPANRAQLANLKETIRDRRQEIVVREYAVDYAGLRIDPSLLPADLSAEERGALADGVIEPDEWAGLSEAVQQIVEERGTVAFTEEPPADLAAAEGETEVLGGLKQLGDRMLADLWRAIEAEIPAGPPALGDHERERAFHERFLRERTRLFLGRKEEIRRVLAYAEEPGDPHPLVVTGAPGSGKSAFLAASARLCRRLCRERSPETLVLAHFIGASPGSSDLHATLRSLCEELRRRAGLEEEVPLDLEKLQVQLPLSLEAAAEKGKRVVLFLDALNQLDPGNQGHQLRWFPHRLPHGVKVVVSSLAGPALEALKARVPEDHVLDVPPLPPELRQALIRRHLALRRKKLGPEQLEELLDEEKRPESGLPLYLLVALEELSLFGDYETLGHRIRQLPPTLPELFAQVLARLEHDHGEELTRSVLSWIAASRSGLREREILDLLEVLHATREEGRLDASRSALLEPEILAVLDRPEPRFPPYRWARFYLALEFYLRPVEEEQGLLAFYHDQLRFAAFQRYLGMEHPENEPTKACQQAHRELAAYFRHLCCLPGGDGEIPRWHPDRLREAAIPPERWPEPALERAREEKPIARGLSELPYHLTQAGSWDELYAVLTDLGFLEAKCTYVNPIETGEGDDRRTLYTGVYELQEDYRRALERMPTK